MKLTNSLAALLLVPLTLFTTSATAWRAVFNGTDGRIVERSGSISLDRCHMLLLDPPLTLGQVTFDEHTVAWWDPTLIVVYADSCCDNDFRIYAGVPSLRGQEVYPSSRVKSFKVM